VKKVSILVSFLSLFVFFHLSSIDLSDIRSRSKGFKRYLKGLSWQMAAPWSVIQMSAKALGLSQIEIDAIPVAFPFLYEERYKQVFGKLETNDMIELTNRLLKQFQDLGSSLTSSKKRELLHHLVHILVIQELGLASSTTTKQLADMVSKNQVSIERLCEIQLAAFFVKYYLNL